jgi:hypothetical protein
MSASRPGGLGPDETIDLVGMDSFPASDPPSWSATHAGGPVAPRGPEMLRDVIQRIREDVRLLSDEIGERNDRSPQALRNLERAAAAIERRFEETGLPVKRRRASDSTFNIEAVVRGGDRAVESVVVGAHYDSPPRSPGAEDNASGVAALLALAHALQGVPHARTVRLVAFANGVPPHAGTEHTGSACYERELSREGPRVTSMLSLASLGLYLTAVPWPLRFVRPLRADLLLIGRRDARPVLGRAERAFAAAKSGISSSSMTMPHLFAGLRASDHWPFARKGIPALMVTDAAPFWAPTYGGRRDAPERLDYDRLGRTSIAVAEVVRELATFIEEP